MNPKVKLIMPFIVFAALIIGGNLLANVSSKDNDSEIAKVVNEKIAHIEYLSENDAVAIYKSNDNKSLGYVLLKKGYSNWRQILCSTAETISNGNISGAYWCNPDISIAMGEIFDSNINSIMVINNNREFQAQVIDYNNSKIWYAISNNFEPSEVTIVGLTQDGTIQETLPDIAPKLGLN